MPSAMLVRADSTKNEGDSVPAITELAFSKAGRDEPRNKVKANQTAADENQTAANQKELLGKRDSPVKGHNRGS